MGMFHSINERALSSTLGGLFLGIRVRFECPRQLTKFAVASCRPCAWHDLVCGDGKRC